MLPNGCFYIDDHTYEDLHQTVLHGYALNEDSVVFESEGLAAWRKQNPHGALPDQGRHALIAVGSDHITLRTDITGQESLYLFRSGSAWALSNSFLLLANGVAPRHRLTFYPPAAIAFHLKDGRHIGEQIPSHRTPIAEIELLPATAEISIDRTTGALTIAETPLPAVALLREADHGPALLHYLERAAGLLAALAETGWPMRLLLSGGYDSRLVLALLLASGRPDSLRVASDQNRTDDFQAAQSICRRLGLPLNVPGNRSQPRLSASDALRVYLLSCGGTYLPIYPVTHFHPPATPRLRLTGDQPTSWDHYLGRGAFNGTPTQIAQDIRLALADRPHANVVAQDFLDAFPRHGIDPDHPGAMLAYYSAVRSRHHCGRHWYKNLGGERLVSPLMLPDLLGIEMALAKRSRPPGQVFADAFSALGGWVLEEPFERPDRAISPARLAASPFRNGAQIVPRPMTVYGDWRAPNRAGAPEPPDLLALPLPFSHRGADIRTATANLLRNAHHARCSEVFTPQDIRTAEREVTTDGPPSQTLRRSAHVIAIDTVLAIIAESGGLTSAR